MKDDRAIPLTKADRTSAIDFYIAELRTILDFGGGGDAAWEPGKPHYQSDRLYVFTAYISPEWKVKRLKSGRTYRISTTCYFSRKGCLADMARAKHLWLEHGIVPKGALLKDLTLPFQALIKETKA